VLTIISFPDTPGTTILTYTPDGRRVITAGSNSAIRVYNIGQDGEPKTIDEGVEAHFGIAATVNYPA
jgi:chromosome transmission fidelity protein 4